MSGPIIIGEHGIALFDQQHHRDHGGDDCQYYNPINRTIEPCYSDGHYMCVYCKNYVEG